MRRDGTGSEILRHQDVRDYLEAADSDASTAVLRTPVEGYPGVTGITVLKPFPGKTLVIYIFYLCCWFDWKTEFSVGGYILGYSHLLFFSLISSLCRRYWENMASRKRWKDFDSRRLARKGFQSFPSRWDKEDRAKVWDDGRWGWPDYRILNAWYRFSLDTTWMYRVININCEILALQPKRMKIIRYFVPF